MRSPDYSALPEGAMPVPPRAPRPPENPYQGDGPSLRPLGTDRRWPSERGPDGLTALERAVLDLEHNGGDGWPGADHGSKHNAATERLGISLARFYQLLLRVIDTEAGQAYNPVLCHRLQELRARRRAVR